MKNDEATKDVVGDPGVFVEWAGNDRRLVAYPCSNNKIYNLCGFMPTAESGKYAEGMYRVFSLTYKLHYLSVWQRILKSYENRLASSRR